MEDSNFYIRSAGIIPKTDEMVYDIHNAQAKDVTV